MDDRSSLRSASTLSGGYETPDEELPEEEEPKEVTFSTHVEVAERSVHSDDGLDHSKIDRKRFRHLKRPKLGKGISAQVFRRYPRCYACWCGMIFPLWFLVALSLAGGKFLGDFEFHQEIAANNEAMKNRMLAEIYDQRVEDTITHSPGVCYGLYSQGVAIENLTDAWTNILGEEDSLDDFVQRKQEELLNSSVAFDYRVNISDFSTFLDACGTVANDLTEDIQRQTFGEEEIAALADGAQTLSFNWIRCVNRTVPQDFNHIFQPTQAQIYEAQFGNQSRVFRREWREEQRALEASYREEFASNGTNTTFGRTRAFDLSIQEASGTEVCAVNVAGTAWFWFTIMTTVGYGNQAPTSVGGRVMIFTFGFLSILIFASVLATSGSITSLIVNDFVKRMGFRILVNKFVMMVIWGSLWLIWLLFMAAHYRTWRTWRLETGDADLPYEDAYWWAYISTTTIGLGDFYPEPEVMFIVDLLTFTLSFLFGFVLLSAFLTDLSNFLGQLMPDYFSGELAKRVKYVGVTPIPGLLDGVRDDSDTFSEMSASDRGKDDLTEEPDLPPLPESSMSWKNNNDQQHDYNA